MAKRMLFALTFALIACEPNVFQPIDSDTSREADGLRYTKEGDRFSRLGDFTQAIRSYELALELDSTQGYARLGLVKASFEKFRINPREFLVFFLQDSSVLGNLELLPINRFFTLNLKKIDSLYRPIHHGVKVLAPMFEDGYRSSDRFDPHWVFRDYAMLRAISLVVGILDVNGDGRIGDADYPFNGLELQVEGRKVSIKGLLPIMDSPDYARIWSQRKKAMADEISGVRDLCIEAFDDSSRFSVVLDFLEAMEAYLERQE